MKSVARDILADENIAHTSLRGRVEASAFTEGTLKRASSCPTVDLRATSHGLRTDRQILFGHPVLQLESNRGLSRDETSGYVGYVNPISLVDWVAPTHRVTARATLLFSKPDFKSYNPYQLSLGSLLRIEATEGDYLCTSEGQYVIASHLSPVAQSQPDLAATAEKLLGTPYLWGGNSTFGIDCSGLVQMACQAAGVPCPGDSDQQMDLGAPASGGYQRNDLLFWKGHVALVADPDTMIHANAHSMSVAYEPIKDAIARIAAKGDGPVTGHRRLPPLSGLNSSPPEG